jgi:lipoprotein NlpI
VEIYSGKWISNGMSDIGKDLTMARPLRILLMTTVVLALVFAGCNGKQKTATGEKISEKELSGEQEKQKEQLQKKIDKKYGDARPHYELGKLYHSQGMWDKAEWEYDQAIAFDPMHHEAQASIVKLQVDKGDTTKSGVVADLYINQASVSAKHSLLLGRAFQSRGLDQYALACYKQAHNLAPDSVAINKQLAYYYLAKKDNAKAEMYLRRTFELDPKQAEVAGELGRLGVRVQLPTKEAKQAKKVDKVAERQEKKELKEQNKAE